MPSVLLVVVSAALVLLLNTIPVIAADFYIDPALGSPANDGSVNRPWKSLQNVLASGLVESREWEALPYGSDSNLAIKNRGAPVKAGDTIWLRDGSYGDLSIRGFYNSDFITIAALRGHRPFFNSIHLQSTANWALKGLHVRPVGSGNKHHALVQIEPHITHGPLYNVVVEDGVLSSAANTSKWSAEDWNRRSRDGIYAGGTHITLRRNQLTNINHGITITASHSLIEKNTIENFAGDGIRGLGDHGVYQYNLIKNCYDVNDNHDDGFQSWSRGPMGKSGQGVVTGIVLRGNTIINYEDSDQLHRGTLQGIGCFDGFFADWIIENNVVVVDHWHGITLLGAHNCRIVNNTVIDRNKRDPGPPWIRIGKHKNGQPSVNCVVRNNLVPKLNIESRNGNQVDHNMIIEDSGQFFKNALMNDFRLNRGSPPIDTGSSDLAPKIDIVGTLRPQGDGVDLGAYEYTAE